MDKINLGISCDVSNCKFNHNGCNCTLDKIHVGCCHDSDNDTCCESFSDKM